MQSLIQKVLENHICDGSPPQGLSGAGSGQGVIPDFEQISTIGYLPGASFTVKKRKQERYRSVTRIEQSDSHAGNRIPGPGIIYYPAMPYAPSV
jgi:hypothetical protein